MKYIFLGILTTFSLTLLSNIYIINRSNSFPMFNFFVILPYITKDSDINVASYITDVKYSKNSDEIQYLIR
jgi:hypothetical protein